MTSSKTEVTTTRVVWDDPDLPSVVFEYQRDDNGDVREVTLKIVAGSGTTVPVAKFYVFAQLVADVVGDI